MSATYSTPLHSSEKGKEKNLQAFHGNLTEKRKRSSKPHKVKWKKMKNRKLGMEEEAYLSYKRSKDGEVTQDTERYARNLGPECSYKMCQNSKVRGCNLISNERRHLSGILENYDLGTEDRSRIKSCEFHSYEKTWQYKF